MTKVFTVVRWISAALGWSLFFFWWKVVLGSRSYSQRTATVSLLAIFALLLAAVIYCIVWIFHNKRIARRGKRGNVSFYKSPKFERDAIGRELKLLPIDYDHPAPVIIVRSTAETKEFLVEGLVDPGAVR